MKIEKTALEGLLILKPKIHYDKRGFFMESWREEWLDLLNSPYRFIQDNHARSEGKGVLRGLHYQKNAQAQGKMIWASVGRIYDVAVDLRKSSPTFGKSFGLELSAENAVRLFIPRGYAHGYMTLSAITEIQYKTDNYYAPESEAGLIWNDPDLDIEWPDIAEPVLSDKDQLLPRFKDINSLFD